MFVDALIPLRIDDLVHILEQDGVVVELDLHSIETTIPGELHSPSEAMHYRITNPGRQHPEY